MTIICLIYFQLRVSGVPCKKEVTALLKSHGEVVGVMQIKDDVYLVVRASNAHKSRSRASWGYQAFDFTIILL